MIIKEEVKKILIESQSEMNDFMKLKKEELQKNKSKITRDTFIDEFSQIFNKSFFPMAIKIFNNPGDDTAIEMTPENLESLFTVYDKEVKSLALKHYKQYKNY